MTIDQIYDHYRIIPSLRLHMQRVATVWASIVDYRTGPEIDKDRIAQTLLMHDLWNILKFDFSLYTDFFEPEWVEYRQKVRDRTRQFGETEVEATLAMARQVCDDQSVIALLEELIMYPLSHSIQSDNRELKICDFADMCVTPFKICHRSERIDQAIERVTKGHCPKDAERKIQLRREMMVVLDEQVMGNVSLDFASILEATQK